MHEAALCRENVVFWMMEDSTMLMLIVSVMLSQVSPDRAAPRDPAMRTTMQDFGEGVLLIETEQEDSWLVILVPDSEGERWDAKKLLDSAVIALADKRTGEITLIKGAASGDGNVAGEQQAVSCNPNGCGGSCCGFIVGEKACIYCICCVSGMCAPAGGACFPPAQ